MLHALYEGQMASAFPGARGTCPGCFSEVIAKCGPVTVPHWAHVSQRDCDSWSEPVSQWHLDWQSLVPPERREVVIGSHRADMVTHRGEVYEVQHSHLSADEIREREEFYGPNMAWIFDARDAFAAGRIDLRAHPGKQWNYRTFRWKHPRKSLAVAKRAVFLDSGLGFILVMRRLHAKSPSGGWGYILRSDCLRSSIAGHTVTTGDIEW